LGLYLMQKWMDEVHFEFCQDCNRLVMVKHKEKKA
jgi:anti-sigma regulatory factor (Ser/Thr protein kinase)